MFDIWSNKVDIAEEIYKKENYKIKINNKCHTNTCYIFFSSNNIWYPNTEDAFKRSFVDNDYYEWMRFTDLPAEKVVYIRDIYKSWYVSGINKELNSIDAVIAFLRKQTAGMKVVTVGSSAGGYMASLTAALLNAECCVCFSAQFDLTVEGALGANPLLKKYSKDDNRNQYYNIINIIRNSKTHIFYFVPAYSEYDKEQMNKVADIENVHMLKIASHHHGVPLFSGNLGQLLQMDKDSLVSLFESYEYRVVGMLPMSIKLSGIVGTCNCIKYELIKTVRKYIRR